jgi:hypothetical protein
MMTVLFGINLIDFNGIKTKLRPRKRIVSYLLEKSDNPIHHYGVTTQTALDRGDSLPVDMKADTE